MTNHTSNQETSSAIILDTYHPSTPTPPTGAATNNYSLTLSNLDLAILGHLRLTDQWYGIGGFSISTLTGNSFSASQQLSGNYYINLANQGQTLVSSQQITDSSLTNWFTGFRGDLQFGAGSVFRLGSSNMLLDAELLVGIPLTSWLTKVADSSRKCNRFLLEAALHHRPTSVVCHVDDRHSFSVPRASTTT